ncbi:uncharacterized protein N7496_010977 [Penicillium cataractarum]|uniref:Uncharacterized protein n=1 Tax=Penicillium cataractarum TaxID=2100454 RepID=A0A9W9RGQ2_9EURO|nr:uncharacterized protein N7496_010977 [Penicillium cataractarum]KAJ5358564.1 hypothetical protein N7496_010977 [Penicillium cataractarum]
MNDAAGDDEAKFLINNQIHTSVVVGRVVVRPAAAERIGAAVSIHSSVNNPPAQLSKLAIVIDSNHSLAGSSEQSLAHSLEGLTAILGTISRGHHQSPVVGHKLSSVEGEAVIATVTVDEQLELGDLLVDNRNTTTKDGLNIIVALIDIKGEVASTLSRIDSQQARGATLTIVRHEVIMLSAAGCEFSVAL